MGNVRPASFQRFSFFQRTSSITMASPSRLNWIKKSSHAKARDSNWSSRTEVSVGSVVFPGSMVSVWLLLPRKWSGSHVHFLSTSLIVHGQSQQATDTEEHTQCVDSALMPDLAAQPQHVRHRQETLAHTERQGHSRGAPSRRTVSFRRFLCQRQVYDCWQDQVSDVVRTLWMYLCYS